jgi:myo-inositol-1(or 4)-monophosphatase
MDLGPDLLELCKLMSHAAAVAIEDIVGTPEANKKMYMGADGTVTKKIDDLAERAIFEVLKKDGRSMRVVSEEFGEKVLGDDPEFSITLDPLDGTYNAAFGIPFYSVSIAIGKPDLSDIWLGYVENLADGDVFHAIKGEGAYLNGEPVKASSHSDLRDFCISAYGYHPHMERTEGISKRARRIRVLGSVALELCYVAAGKIDAFVDIRGALRITDVAAGKLIVEESGGIVTNGFGSPLKLKSNVSTRVDMIASNGHAHMDILRLTARE